MSNPAPQPRKNRRRGRREDEPDVRLSKTLSHILRHGAVDAGISMDDAGYVALDELLSSPGFGSANVDDVRRIVQTNDKQRYSIVETDSGRIYIRANQGHSGRVAALINPEKLLHRLEVADLQPESICVHGTTLEAWNSIQEEGLSRMRRQMIHCAVGLPGEDGIISGMRPSSKVLIFVDVYAAVRDGVPFFSSANHVLLTPGVGDSGILPKIYFKRVERRDTGEVLMESLMVT